MTITVCTSCATAIVNNDWTHIPDDEAATIQERTAPLGRLGLDTTADACGCELCDTYAETAYHLIAV